MSLYSIALFAHIVGALSLFALLAIEGASLRAGIAAGVVQRILGPISALLILVPGFYMVVTSAGWRGWAEVGLVSYVVIAVLGTFTGISVMRGRMSARAATISWLARVGMALGVVFDMSVKPDVLGAAIAVAVGLAAGVAIGALTRRQVRTA
jgi:hypothetical protein